MPGKVPLYYFYLAPVLFLFLMGAGCSGPSQPEKAFSSQLQGTVVTTGAIGPEGGTIEASDSEDPIAGAKAQIPQGAMGETREITLNQAISPENLPEGVTNAGKVVDFGPEGIVFQQPVDLTLPYNDKDDDGLIDGTEIDEKTVGAVYFNKISGQWQQIPVKNKDTENNLITIESSHFSQYTAVSYLTETCKTGSEFTSGPYYFTLYYNFRYSENGFSASVSDIGVDLGGGNARLDSNQTAVLDNDGFSDLFDKVLDARRWTWTFEVVDYLTFLTRKAGLEDQEVETEITAVAAKSLEFSWNFDYHDMAPDEMLVVKFSGTTDSLCTLLDKTPSIPLNLKVVGVTDSSISMSWDEVAFLYGDVNYNMYISEDNGATFSLYTRRSNTFGTAGSLSPDTTYYFKVTASYPGGLESGESNVASATTDIANQPPLSPQNLAAGEAGRDYAALSWDAATDSDGQVAYYNVYISDDDQATYGTVISTADNGTSYTAVGLLPSTTYYFKVSAVDDDNAESEKSQPVSADTLQ